MRHALPAQASRGCCPGRAAARRTRDIPTKFRAASACHRQFGGDVDPRRPSRGLALHAASRAYRPTSRARMSCIDGRSGGQAKAHSVAKLRGGFAEEAGFASTDRSEHVALVQKAPKTALGWAAAPTQVHQAQLRHQRGAAEKEAGSPTHREVPVGEGPPVRQRRDRVCQQQPEGARSLRVASRHQTSAAEGQRVGAVLQQREDPLDLGLHEPSRVQGRQGRPSGNYLIICSKSND